MNTIISKYEYEVLLRKYQKRNLYASSIALLSIAVIEFIVMIILLIFTDEFTGSENEWLVLLLPLVFIIIAFFLYIAAKRIDRKEVAHYSFTIYDDYESEGTKVPLYRIVQRGKNSETIYTMMILNESSIQLLDLRRKGIKPYISSDKAHTVFKFYIKHKNNEDMINKKFDLIINGRKHRIYGFKEVNQKLLSFCELEDYQVEIIKK